MRFQAIIERKHEHDKKQAGQNVTAAKATLPEGPE
jgi:hypothetical protein